jgi:hypothetical protein
VKSRVDEDQRKADEKC